MKLKKLLFLPLISMLLSGCSLLNLGVKTRSSSESSSLTSASSSSHSSTSSNHTTSSTSSNWTSSSSSSEEEIPAGVDNYVKTFFNYWPSEYVYSFTKKTSLRFVSFSGVNVYGDWAAESFTENDTYMYLLLTTKGYYGEEFKQNLLNAGLSENGNDYYYGPGGDCLFAIFEENNVTAIYFLTLYDYFSEDCFFRKVTDINNFGNSSNFIIACENRNIVFLPCSSNGTSLNCEFLSIEIINSKIEYNYFTSYRAFEFQRSENQCIIPIAGGYYLAPTSDDPNNIGVSSEPYVFDYYFMNGNIYIGCSLNGLDLYLMLKDDSGFITFGFYEKGYVYGQNIQLYQYA